MDKKKNKNTDAIVVGVSTASGSILGSVSAKAATNMIDSDVQPAEKGENHDNDDKHDTDEVVVITHIHGDDTQGYIVDDPGQQIIVEDMYGGPEPPMYGGPEPDDPEDPWDPEDDPIVCVYGPPEPDILIDPEFPDDDFLP